MANIREIQSRINSVKDTMKITNAMYISMHYRVKSVVFYVIYRNYITAISTRGKTFRQRNVRLDRSLSRRTRDWPVLTITIL